MNALIKVNPKLSRNKLVEINCRIFDFIVASVAILVLSPLMLVNVISAIATGNKVVEIRHETDALSRRVIKKQFGVGLLKTSAQLIDIFWGRYAFCGVSTNVRSNLATQELLLRHSSLKRGFFSLADINVMIGLVDKSTEELLVEQAQYNFKQYVGLFVKGLFCLLFYSQRSAKTNKQFEIFNISINNDTMLKAVDKVVNKQAYRFSPKSVFFINAHSVNLSQRNPSFGLSLAQADYRFADGSGIRLAALKNGFRLKDNVNGTDMLPEICKACVEQSKSIYFLGAAPGIAKLASEKLVQSFPGLKVAGYEHGFHRDYTKIISDINSSEAHIVLVAMGSPRQEEWVNEYKSHLRCETVLAVGGLLDFYSQKIPRAPRWMRETGMEWVFRLYKEPVNKFKRYVIGTPEFLIRTFLMKQA